MASEHVDVLCVMFMHAQYSVYVCSRIIIRDFATYRLYRLITVYIAITASLANTIASKLSQC